MIFSSRTFIEIDMLRKSALMVSWHAEVRILYLEEDLAGGSRFFRHQNKFSDESESLPLHHLLAP